MKPYEGDAITDLKKVAVSKTGALDLATLPDFTKIRRGSDVYENVKVDVEVPMDVNKKMVTTKTRVTKRRLVHAADEEKLDTEKILILLLAATQQLIALVEKHGVEIGELHTKKEGG
jgi:hypothetical protein